MTSILTNAGVVAALRTLRSISSDMETVQGQISSGLRVANSSDNAAYWSISTTMRSDNKAMSAVSDALGLAAAKVDTAYTGLNGVIDILDDFKAKLVAAKKPGVQNQVTEDGRHNKDWRNSPDAEKQFEYIDFNGDINPNQLEVYVHFYEGNLSGGARGVIRLWFNGQVYEASFHIAAEQGNMGATERPDLMAGQPEWLKITS